MFRRTFSTVVTAVVTVMAPMISAAGNPGYTDDGKAQFLSVAGPDIIDEQGCKFFITGTNLGNWLNPEGYMFGFGRTNSPRMINDLICQLIGPDAAADFWREFKDNYITRADIEFIASTGANTIRLPFHYKLFTDEDYMGLTDAQDGFARVDSVVTWCRDNGLHLILDMHDAPGGQTGDNIDDSYGYPWLFESEASQNLYCDIWRKIADRYADEPVILGYELFNEPIAPYFDNVPELNGRLSDLYRIGFDAIRQVDKKHMVLLGGAQWNGNFEPLYDTLFDEQVMYTCHRYGGDPTPEAISNFISFRDKLNRPMYMGEIGHNTDEWQAEFVRTMRDANIGYTFWPYKKIKDSCMVGYTAPEGWDTIVKFSEAPRGTYKEIREAAPSHAEAQQLLNELLRNVRFENCTPQQGYINSLQLK